MPTTTTAKPRIACEWTCPRTKRAYTLSRRGRLWLLAWETEDDDWSIGGGRSIPEAFLNCGVRRIPTGFPYRGSGCARRRASRAATRA
jgi:hypothetical protein